MLAAEKGQKHSLILKRCEPKRMHILENFDFSDS